MVPSDIVFIVDSTGFENSPQDVSNWRFLTTYLRDLVARLGPTIRVAVVQYADNARTVFTLNEQANIIDGIGNIRLFNTNGRNALSGINEAVRTVFQGQNGDRPNVPNLAVVIIRGPEPRQQVGSAVCKRVFGCLLPLNDHTCTCICEDRLSTDISWSHHAFLFTQNFSHKCPVLHVQAERTD